MDKKNDRLEGDPDVLVNHFFQLIQFIEIFRQGVRFLLIGVLALVFSLRYNEYTLANRWWIGQIALLTAYTYCLLSFLLWGIRVGRGLSSCFRKKKKTVWQYAASVGKTWLTGLELLIGIAVLAILFVLQISHYIVIG